MSEEQSAHHTKNEIIIVKRRGDDDHDGHHGGVWKIAYADFMTAMMAFFLVMWLINAANDQTKASVASYFNPIKLVDQRPSDKGIKDEGQATKQGELAQKTQNQGKSASTGDGGQTGQQQNSAAGEKTQYSEADYFENPYSVLSEIAQQTGEKANISTSGSGGAQKAGPATGASGGTAYRDPFDPNFWSQQVQTAPGVQISRKDKSMPVAGATATGGGTAAKEPTSQRAKAAADAATPKTNGEKSKDGGKGLASQDAENHAPAAATEPKPDSGKPSEKAEQAAAKLRKEIAKATGGVVGKLAEGISVKPAEGGVLVSITDRVDDGMFNVGSAVPSHDMVLAMQKIGEVLSHRKGSVLIRGYTDARPYKGKDYDNWRLSSARAQSAYYMLVRGGLDEERVKQISGFADRHLLLPDHPFDPANRRIEILVGTKGEAQ